MLIFTVVSSAMPRCGAPADKGPLDAGSRAPVGRKVSTSLVRVTISPGILRVFAPVEIVTFLLKMTLYFIWGAGYT